MSNNPFEKPPVTIALVVYTKDDPIHVDPKQLTNALSFMGYSAGVVSLDWANEEEWTRLTDPLGLRDHGHHTISNLRDDSHTYVCRWYGGPDGGFVRDFEDGTGDLIPVIP